MTSLFINPKDLRLETFAAQMRAEPTPIEAIMEKVIVRRQKVLGYIFESQVVIGPFIVDFYCEELRLAIETDGKQHLKTKSADAARDAWLKNNRNITVLRYSGRDCFRRSAVRAVRRYLRDRRLPNRAHFCSCGQYILCRVNHCSDRPKGDVATL